MVRLSKARIGKRVLAAFARTYRASRSLDGDPGMDSDGSNSLEPLAAAPQLGLMDNDMIDGMD